MKIKKYIQNILHKYIGKIKYVVTAVSTNGVVKIVTLDSIKYADEFVDNINTARWLVPLPT